MSDADCICGHAQGRHRGGEGKCDACRCFKYRVPSPEEKFDRDCKALMRLFYMPLPTERIQ